MSIGFIYYWPKYVVRAMLSQELHTQHISLQVHSQYLYHSIVFTTDSNTVCGISRARSLYIDTHTTIIEFTDIGLFMLTADPVPCIIVKAINEESMAQKALSP